MIGMVFQQDKLVPTIVGVGPGRFDGSDGTGLLKSFDCAFQELHKKMAGVSFKVDKKIFNNNTILTIQ
jgi:hypothetical protein